jgi:hypothetical protein
VSTITGCCGGISHEAAGCERNCGTRSGHIFVVPIIGRIHRRLDERRGDLVGPFPDLNVSASDIRRLIALIHVTRLAHVMHSA